LYFSGIIQLAPHTLRAEPILDSRTGRGIPKMPVDRLIETRKENGAGNDRNPARDRPHQHKQKKLGNGRAGVG